MKKIFNLAVALSVLASSVALSSCDKDDPEDEPNNGSEVVTPGNEDKPADKKEVIGTYADNIALTAGSKIAIKSEATTAVIKAEVKAADSKSATLVVNGAEVKIGSGDLPSFATVDGTTITAANKDAAEAAPKSVIFIFKEGSLVTPSKAANKTVNPNKDENTGVGEGNKTEFAPITLQ